MELFEENVEAAEVYMATRRQYRTAEHGRVVDIDLLAVKAVMDLYEVKDQRACLDAVRRLFHECRSGEDDQSD